MTRGGIRQILSLGGALTLALFTLHCQSSRDNQTASQVPGIQIIGGRGLAPGQFMRPRAVICDTDGRLFVIDRSGWVQRLAPDGSPETRWRLPAWDNGTPTGMTLDDKGNLWVADTHYSRILVYTPDGEMILQFGESAPPSGEIGPGQMIFPTDVALDGRGHVYVTEYGNRVRVLRFTEEGEFIDEWNPRDPETGDDLLMRPMAIVWEESRGDLLLADSCHHRLVRMSPEGEILESIGHEGTGEGEFRYPYDVALGPAGEIYVCEWENMRVQRLAADGTFERSWGGQGREPGELFSPWGVTVRPDGALVVADTENHRLQVMAQ
ncbi:hypothetical protein JXA47_05920 [Candidatus Sumerlaeota bacterium]|nr:hypothetical protein [Candidatus Sumerlaeota bacterium]